MYGYSAEAVAATRRMGMPFGGHVLDAVGNGPPAMEASDLGYSIVDHPNVSGGLDTLCLGERGTVQQCQPLADRFRQNGTWWVPTLVFYVVGGEPGVGGPRSQAIAERLGARADEFWGRALPPSNWPREDKASSDSVGYFGYLEVAQQAGLPILAGTDTELDNPPELSSNPLDNPLAPELTLKPVGFSLHAELAMYVAEGLMPLNALQSATLNPAKLIHGTDSLGTVAAGKLADLVLLDADPLADITNTTAIRAVVANGRYFDRAALDQLLVDVQRQVKQGYRYWVTNIGAYDDERASKMVDGTPP